MKKRLFAVVFCLFFVFSFSFAQEQLKDSISEIEHSLKNNHIKALWRYSLLISQNEYSAELEDAFSNCLDSCLKEISEIDLTEKPYDFYVKYSTVSEIYNQVSPFLKKDYSSVSELNDKFLSLKKQIFETNLSNLKKSSYSKSEKMARYIDGTATIWVDLGVKISEGRAYSNRAIGSGFFIDKNGYLITNYHVISSEVDPKYEGISRLYIKYGKNTDVKIPAKVVGYDQGLDLALLKVEISPDYVFALGSSEDLDIGDKIYAIGSPVGLERTLTSGIISAEDRQLFSTSTVLQLDAAINQGNSGGPIIDEFGNVQGIAFAGMLSYEGLNFAIPVETLKLILPRLYCGMEIKAPYIGVYGKNLKNGGIEVLWMESTSNAHKAGLKVGDVITEVNGKKVSTLNELHTVFNMADSGSLIHLSVLTSDGKAKKLSVYADERAEYPLLSVYENENLGNAIYPIYGMKLKRSSSLYKSKFTVESVVQGSSADEAGFTENDPVQLSKSKVQDGKVLYTELYSKKKSNGYLDVSLVMPALLDNENIF